MSRKEEVEGQASTSFSTRSRIVDSPEISRTRNHSKGDEGDGDRNVEHEPKSDDESEEISRSRLKGVGEVLAENGAVVAVRRRVRWMTSKRRDRVGGAYESLETIDPALESVNSISWWRTEL